MKSVTTAAALLAASLLLAACAKKEEPAAAPEAAPPPAAEPAPAPEATPPPADETTPPADNSADAEQSGGDKVKPRNLIPVRVRCRRSAGSGHVQAGASPFRAARLLTDRAASPA